MWPWTGPATLSGVRYAASMLPHDNLLSVQLKAARKIEKKQHKARYLLMSSSGSLSGTPQTPQIRKELSGEVNLFLVWGIRPFLHQPTN